VHSCYSNYFTIYCQKEINSFPDANDVMPFIIGNIISYGHNPTIFFVITYPK